MRCDGIKASALVAKIDVIMQMPLSRWRHARKSSYKNCETETLGVSNESKTTNYKLPIRTKTMLQLYLRARMLSTQLSFQKSSSEAKIDTSGKGGWHHRSCADHTRTSRDTLRKFKHKFLWMKTCYQTKSVVIITPVLIKMIYCNILEV